MISTEAAMKDEKQIRHYISPDDEIPDLVIDGVPGSFREVPAHETPIEWISGVSVPGAR